MFDIWFDSKFLKLICQLYLPKKYAHCLFKIIFTRWDKTHSWNELTLESNRKFQNIRVGEIVWDDAQMFT